MMSLFVLSAALSKVYPKNSFPLIMRQKEGRMKKISIIVLTSLAMSSAYAAGANKSKQLNKPQLSDTMDVSNQGETQPAETKTVYGNTGPKLASARPQIDGFGTYVFGQALWWHAQEDGTDWVNLQQGENTTLKFRNRDIDFGWDPGFRVGIGWNTSCDDWDTNFSYTWFFTKKKDNVVLGETGIETVPFFEPLFGAGDGSIEWNIHFSMFDWELGRNFFVSPRLSLRPHLGIKGGWINQDVKNEFEIPFLVLNSETHLENNLWYVGPSGGVNTKWFFANTKKHAFSLFGDFTGALMWGQFHIKNKTAFDDLNEFEFPNGDVFDADEVDIIDLSKNRSVAMLQTVFGWAWDVNFNKDRCHFALKLGWEIEYWFGVNQLAYTLPNSSTLMNNSYLRFQKDLILQGGIGELRFDF